MLIFKPTLAFLNQTRGQWRTVATDTKVSYDTIKSIHSGRIRNPGVLTIERLFRYAQTRKGQQVVKRADRR